MEFEQNNLVCFVCDSKTELDGVYMSKVQTCCSKVTFADKIGQIVGDAFLVVVSEEDRLCRRCVSLLNESDKLEKRLTEIKMEVNQFINTKYNLEDPTDSYYDPAETQTDDSRNLPYETLEDRLSSEAGRFSEFQYCKTLYHEDEINMQEAVTGLRKSNQPVNGSGTLSPYSSKRKNIDNKNISEFSSDYETSMSFPLVIDGGYVCTSALETDPNSPEIENYNYVPDNVGQACVKITKRKYKHKDTTVKDLSNKKLFKSKKNRTKKTQNDSFTDDSDEHVSGSYEEGIKCDGCPKIFKNMASLSCHKRYICGQDAKQLCPFCPYKAKLGISVRVHIARNHHKTKSQSAHVT